MPFRVIAEVVRSRWSAIPIAGHLLVFRGRRGDLIKAIWHDGQGACLYTKRLDRGRFRWPSVADGAVTISTAQLGYLLGKTRTGRLWTVVRDDRPFGGPEPPAAAHFYSPDRSGAHAETWLSDFHGIV